MLILNLTPQLNVWSARNHFMSIVALWPCYCHGLEIMDLFWSNISPSFIYSHTNVTHLCALISYHPPQLLCQVHDEMCVSLLVLIGSPSVIGLSLTCLVRGWAYRETALILWLRVSWGLPRSPLRKRNNALISIRWSACAVFEGKWFEIITSLWFESQPLLCHGCRQ